MSIVKVKGLTKIYPQLQLKDVNFSLEKGRITGFIGRNGAGKTTAMKSMMNLIHPDAGEILFFGKPLKENEAEIKKRIGYSSGTISWYSRKRIREILMKLREEGTSIFFSTHIISDIEKCADDILYISNGVIRKEASKEAFKTPGETLEETFLRMERGNLNG